MRTDLSHCRAHISEGMFSHIAAHSFCRSGSYSGVKHTGRKGIACLSVVNYNRFRKAHCIMRPYMP